MFKQRISFFRLATAVHLSNQIYEEEEQSRYECDSYLNEIPPPPAIPDADNDSSKAKKSRGRPKKTDNSESPVNWSDEVIYLLIDA